MKLALFLAVLVAGAALFIAVTKDGNESLSEWVEFHIMSLLYPPAQMAIKCRDYPHERLIIATKTEPSFLSVVPDPSLDQVIPFFIAKTGVWEPHLTGLFSILLKDRCTGQEKPPLVVDAGANNGYFALYAAALGCQAMAIEPQDRLTPVIRQAAALNEFHDFQTVEAALSSVDGQTHLGTGASRWGGAQVVDKPEKYAVKGKLPSYIKPVSSVTLDTLVPEGDILLLKIDCEGHELDILKGARGLLEHGRIKYLIMELFRMNSAYAKKWRPVLLDLMARGYELHDTHDYQKAIPAAELDEYFVSVEKRYAAKEGVTEVFLSLKE